MNVIECQSLTMNCDACGHQTPVAEAELTPALIGTRCPRCQTVMVTAEDYQQLMAFRLFAQQANAAAQAHGIPANAQTVNLSLQTGPAGPQLIRNTTH